MTATMKTKIMVCTRCWRAAEEIPEAKSGMDVSAHATLSREGNVLYVAPHKGDCYLLNQTTLSSPKWIVKWTNRNGYKSMLDYSAEEAADAAAARHTANGSEGVSIEYIVP